MITHAKIDSDIHCDEAGVLADGWKYVHILDPQTGEPPTDAKGRVILWTEINTREGWGYIWDLDDEEERYLRVEAPWVRLLKIEFFGSPEATDDFL